tara:strand:- start:790 stop:1104 length:315 start_codon:yes stop_codon:yes gene_type:complete
VDKISINIIDLEGQKHTIHASIDLDVNLMELVRDAGFQIGNCGGMALCASCHCFIDTDNGLNHKTLEEEDMLDQLHNSKINSRLICQIPLSQELDGIVLMMASD